MRAKAVAGLLTGAITVASVAAHSARSALAGNDEVHQAGLVTLCSSDGFIRVAAVNDSPLDVTITPQETNGQGNTVNLLGTNASDELQALFPLTIPAGANGSPVFELPLPAHLDGRERKGNEKNLHGSWLPKQWLDENGLQYKGTSGTGAANGTACEPAPTTTPPVTTPPPSSDPVRVRPLAVYSTSNSQLGPLAVDGDPASGFVTQMAAGTPPTWAWLSADLGEQVPMQRIEWLFTAADAADRFWVEVSADGRSWTTVAQPGASQPGAWAGQDVDVTARLVRFYWRNPQNDPQLGYLGELAVWAKPGFAQGQVPVSPSVGEMHSRGEATVDAPTAPKSSGDRYLVQGSKRSSNSPDQSSRLPLDGMSTTAWATSMSVPPRTGWTLYDLGSAVPLGQIRWTFSQVGYADAYKVQVSTDGQRWTTLDTFGNPAAAGAWLALDTDVEARFVRFFFNNPNGDANVGYLAEVRFHAPE